MNRKEEEEERWSKKRRTRACIRSGIATENKQRGMRGACEGGRKGSEPSQRENGNRKKKKEKKRKQN